MLVRLLELIGIVIFIVLAGHAIQISAVTTSSFSVSNIIIAPVIGYFLADLFTGILHWVCDSFGCRETKVFGPMLIAPFRRHHDDPKEITKISLLENLGSSAIAGACVFLIWTPSTSAGILGFTGSVWTWFVVFSVISNLFHRWAHFSTEDKPKWMATLQSAHIILNRNEHLLHHKKPYRVNYCILSGWANPVTNFVQWGKIEARLEKIGIKTNFD